MGRLTFIEGEAARFLLRVHGFSIESYMRSYNPVYGECNRVPPGRDGDAYFVAVECVLPNDHEGTHISFSICQQVAYIWNDDKKEK